MIKDGFVFVKRAVCRRLTLIIFCIQINVQQAMPLPEEGKPFVNSMDNL